ncbi:MAG: type III-B CRISPR module RAMP protein Cmr4 [Calditerrivibrio sp.]|nr:type III-B CRISPR module RAMP protein Cmr4 [Calditerrivibrio sp.]MCA1980399.1 type III-B CRISPR module RAMP protein Cmr4 [Calditerrivibrio sp.]
MRQLASIITFYAVSPIHAGAESSTGAIDNPIQRERHTNYPHIQANGVKGAMRAHYRRVENSNQTINYIFGTDLGNDKDARNYKDENNNDEYMAGAISVSDAKLFAMPVRSNVAPFVWVTCPLILKRLKTDLELVRNKTLENFKIPQPSNEKFISLDWSNEEENIILEDAVVTKEKNIESSELKTLFPDLDKLLVISDQMFKYVSENCTEIQTHIKIDSKTGTAQEGALRYAEYLPSDTVLYGIVTYDKSYFENELKAETIKYHVESSIKDFMQIGGDTTLGRGIVKIRWINGGIQ